MSVLPGFVTRKANPVLAFVFARLAWLTLREYVFGWDFRSAQAIFADPPAPSALRTLAACGLAQCHSSSIDAEGIMPTAQHSVHA